MAEADKVQDIAAILQQAQLAAIVQQSLDAIISKDIDGIVRSWNAAATRIFGWTAEEMIGRSIRTIIPEDRQHEEEFILARIRAGEVIGKFETVRQARDGRLIDVAVTISPLTDAAGNVIGASKIAHDNSETVENRMRLDVSERQFRTLANSIPQLAWIADGDGSIFWYNDRWYDYTGTTLDQVRGWGWTAVHHPDHVERVKERIQKSWDTGTEWEDTFPLRGKDGAYRWFLSRAMPMLDQNGGVSRWFGTNTDITEQRQNEQKIRLLMGEINHRAKNMLAVIQAVVNRTADRKYAEDLAQRLHALGRNQDLLIKRHWTGTTLDELVRSQLAGIGDAIGDRISIDCDADIMINPSAAETIGLALHELSTNAAKYGAMSVPDGRIGVRCSIVRGETDEELRIDWEERDGPAIEPPGRTGFGTVMIDRNPRLGLGAQIEYGFPATGFFWRLRVPLQNVRIAATPDRP